MAKKTPSDTELMKMYGGGVSAIGMHRPPEPKSGPLPAEEEPNARHRLGLKTARERKDEIGPIHELHENCYVIDSKDDLREIDLSGGVTVFVNPMMVKTWARHNRAAMGTPDVSDIDLSDGQREPSIVRYVDSMLELVAGFRRSVAVRQKEGMYLLINLYSADEMTDRTAHIAMNSENNVAGKKAIPLARQILSDKDAIDSKAFKNFAEYSRACGYGSDWASNNLSRYKRVPEDIREAAGQSLMETLGYDGYDKIQKALERLSGEEQTAGIERAVEVIKDKSEASKEFPLAKVLLAISGKDGKTKPKRQVRTTSFGKLKIDTSGMATIELNRGLSEAKLSEIVEMISKAIES